MRGKRSRVYAWIACLAVICTALTSVIAPMPTVYAEPEGPILVTNADELFKMRAKKDYKLANDISLADFNWVPYSFEGRLDGGNFTISGLKLNNTKQFNGLFSYLYGEVNNLTLNEAEVESTNMYQGILAGWNMGTISNVNVNGRVVGKDNVGGLVGYNTGLIDRARANVVVEAVGPNSTSIGGLVGMSNKNETDYKNTVITNSEANGSVKNAASNAGGLVGTNYGDIIGSKSNVEVSGGMGIGGAVGANVGNLIQTSASGNVSGYSSVGGLVGVNNSVTITGKLFAGSIDAQSFYETGRITGTDASLTGAVVGETRNAATSFGFDKRSELSALAPSAGRLNPGFDPAGSEYTLTLASKDSVQVTPTIAHPDAIITIDGVAAVKNNPNRVQLQPDTKKIKIDVAIDDATKNEKRTYTLHVNQISPSAKLTGLHLSSGQLTPDFDENTYSYSATVGNEVDSIQITPTAEDPEATMIIGDVPILSGEPSQSLPLIEGENTFTLRVAASDQQTAKEYTITIVRQSPPAIPVTGISLDQTELTLTLGEAAVELHATVLPADATNPAVSWTSSNSQVATVDQNGMVTPVAKGNATITVTALDNGQTATCDVTVNEQQTGNHSASLIGLQLSSGRLSPALNENDTDYSATVGYQVNSIRITPTAEDPDATITLEGNQVQSGQPSAPLALRTGVNTFALDVTASDQLTTKHYKLTVRRQAYTPVYYPVTDVRLEQTELTMTAGGKAVELNATVIPEYATNPAVSWTSSDPDVAAVDSRGAVTPIAPGDATITVTTLDQAKTATCEVRVDAPVELVRLAASEKTILVKPSETAAFKLFAVYSDGSKADITEADAVRYFVNSRTKIAFTPGVVEAREKKGKVMITVRYKQVSLKIPVIIDDISVDALEPQSANVQLEAEETKQLQVIALLSNQKNQDVTELATWTSSDPAVATVDENGLLAANDAGEATITARYGGAATEIVVTVTEPDALKRLTANKRRLTLAIGDEQKLKLTGYFTNGTKGEVTERAEWVSEDESIATVANGVITANAVGTVDIHAAYRGKSATITVTVKE